MFNIGEFSKITGIPIRTLRFYHDEELLVPANVDPHTNYRSYDDRNLEIARVIVALRALEFSLDDIREILTDCADDADILTYLERQQESLADKLRQYQYMVDKIQSLIENERRAREDDKMNAMTYDINERTIDPLLVAGVRMQGQYADCGKGFAMLGKRLGRHIAGTPLCLFYDGEYRDVDANFEPCMPIRSVIQADGISIRELPGAFCVALIHRGPYDELRTSYARLLRYAKNRGYEIALPTREVYLKGPGMIFRGNPKKYLTEIQLPVKDR